MLKTLENYDAISILIKTNHNKKIGFIIPNKIEKDNSITALKIKPMPFTIENG